MLKRKDGFAVEIVEFEDYKCGNPAYYLKPSRRNQQCKLNGTITKPLYREDLYKGYKKRKRNKDIKFLSYILSADTVPFFNRFSSFKVDKFSCQYFEINLGKVPENINGRWEYNLVYLQSNEICHIDYFTQYCSEINLPLEEPAFIPLNNNAGYEFPPETNKVHFVVPFEKNKSFFESEEITPFLKELSEIDYCIDSININASSSVEGDSILNTKLHRARAQSIVDILQSNQISPIKTNISSKTNWDDFYQEVRKYKKWSFLAKLEKKELLNQINNKYSDSLEFIFKKERFAAIDVFYTIDTTEANLMYFVKKEHKNLLDSLKKYRRNESLQEYYLGKFNHLYEFVHSRVQKSGFDASFLASLSLPATFTSSIPLIEKYILYGYEFPEAYISNVYWQRNAELLMKDLLTEHFKELSSEFIYFDCLKKTNELASSNNTTIENVQSIINELEHIQYFYFSSPIATVNIDKIYFNLNLLLLRDAFITNRNEYSESAMISIRQILMFYRKYNLLDKDKIFQIAKICVSYYAIGFACEILEPYLDDQEILAYYLRLNYRHWSSSGDDEYYQKWLCSMIHTVK